MTYNLENTKKYTDGDLTQISGDGVVAVDYMELDEISAQKLARIVTSGRVTSVSSQ